MCRMVAFLGEERSVRSLTDEPSHSLERQSYAARELESATVNADGWGLAWYVDGQPSVYRSGLPIWADYNRLGLGRGIRSHCLLAAVRSATDPLSHSIANTQPFEFGELSFLHNGFVRNFRDDVRRPLQESLGESAYRAIHGGTDSEHYFGLVIDEWEKLDEGPERLVRAVHRGTERLLELATAAESTALVAVIVSNGRELVFQRRAAFASGERNGRAPSLYYRQASSGLTVASEPLDDSKWTEVTPGEPLVARLKGAQVVVDAA